MRNQSIAMRAAAALTSCRRHAHHANKRARTKLELYVLTAIKQPVLFQGEDDTQERGGAVFWRCVQTKSQRVFDPQSTLDLRNYTCVISILYVY
jgi:hypothetical protein